MRTNPFLEGENDVDIKVYAKWIKKPFQTPKEVQARNLEDVGQARERKLSYYPQTGGVYVQSVRDFYVINFFRIFPILSALINYCLTFSLSCLVRCV